MVLLPLTVIGVVAAMAVPVDTEGAANTAGPSGAGGLAAVWPNMIQRPDNSVTDPHFARRAALGKLLFYDPVLSGKNDMSCATCHHPDFGYSDGRGKAMGEGGKGLGPDRKGGRVIRRGAPTVWNAAFNQTQFWDGRAKDLEDQARNPITAPEEMRETDANLSGELATLPEYQSMFDAAFGGHMGSSINLANVTKALAAFERTQLSTRSPFDRYVAGDRAALTLSQRRGFDVFRSGQARCFECHSLPTFSSPDFKVIGVPKLDDEAEDRGRGDIVSSPALRGAFKVPTLRNVALTAPYMHNGRFQNLDEVVDFYSKGGGPGMGVLTPNLDDKIRPIRLTPQQRQDLIAFLNALTDESALADPPRRVPSTLPVAGRLSSPARTSAARFNRGLGRRLVATVGEFVVLPGQSIQEAIDRAAPGSVIRVRSGEYSESITVDANRITLVGGDGTPATRPVLDGRGVHSDAVIVSGRDFTMSNFEVRHYVGNGVVAQETTNFTLTDAKLEDTGLYGVYPVRSSFVKIQRVEVIGARDAGIYVGQSKGIAIEDCIAHGNVSGVEIENSVDARVERNHVYDNSGGILVFALPGNPSKEAKRTRVAFNRIIGNNHENFADPGSIVSKVPSGGGVFILAADDTEVSENEIRDNNSFGVAVLGLESLFPGAGPFDVGAFSDRTRVHANRFSGNGGKADKAIMAAGLKGADLIWDVTGPTNVWNEPGATAAVPILDERWPAFIRRAMFQFLARAKQRG
ncbi:MAG: right-handed parallel beta-helix repeat-containing protein [Vicinamibacteria bacterium]|nr:right-handed parallel beta-helix repeat-containing protein [Vicinamibacteria bacterium]